MHQEHLPTHKNPSSVNAILSYIEITPDTRNSCNISVQGFSPRRGFLLRTYVAQQATVLLIDIKNFTAQCAAMPAGRVGEWVAAFYKRVDAAAAAHGVIKAEVRGDCCVCVAGVEFAVPWRRQRVSAAAADKRADQATRMLAFAADLHRDLATLHSGGGTATEVRMGMATGQLTFLAGERGSGGSGFMSVQGAAACAAARMEALAGPGAVYVHRSTADKWAAEGHRAPPATVRVDCQGWGAERAAVYDCAGRGFAGGEGAAPAKRLRRASSAQF